MGVEDTAPEAVVVAVGRHPIPAVSLDSSDHYSGVPITHSTSTSRYIRETPNSWIQSFQQQIHLWAHLCRGPSPLPSVRMDNHNPSICFQLLVDMETRARVFSWELWEKQAHLSKSEKDRDVGGLRPWERDKVHLVEKPPCPPFHPQSMDPLHLDQRSVALTAIRRRQESKILYLQFLLLTIPISTAVLDQAPPQVPTTLPGPLSAIKDHSRTHPDNAEDADSRLRSSILFLP